LGAKPFGYEAALMPVAIVTGSDSGIGKASAVALAEAGYDIGITWNTDEDGARDTAAEVESKGRRTAVRQLNADDPADAARMIDDLTGELGEVDVLVNNAGTGVDEPFIEQSLEQWQHVIATNLTGPFAAGQRAAQRMVKAGREGVIVNITSVHEHIPKSGAAAYCASKGGLGLLTKVMALELAQHGIRVNSVGPGEISTPMTGQHEEDPQEQDREGDIPLGRPGHAYEIGRWVAFLASDDASYATGASFVVDGGLMLMAAEMG
jgi:NAD(P)-dependent dehydrogenase (short-subunit alcohol dehydrogenase family)